MFIWQPKDVHFWILFQGENGFNINKDVDITNFDYIEFFLFFILSENDIQPIRIYCTPLMIKNQTRYHFNLDYADFLIVGYIQVLALTKDYISFNCVCNQQIGIAGIGYQEYSNAIDKEVSNEKTNK